NAIAFSMPTKNQRFYSGPVRIEDSNQPFFSEKWTYKNAIAFSMPTKNQRFYSGPSGTNKSFTICELLESVIPASFQITLETFEYSENGPSGI
ncbi:MAG: hypothetical protein ACOCTN_05990, partial [Candidatus Natronoplasma sp.]